jgi:hypothetical protein
LGDGESCQLKAKYDALMDAYNVLAHNAHQAPAPIIVNNPSPDNNALLRSMIMMQILNQRPYQLPPPVLPTMAPLGTYGNPLIVKPQ